MSEFIIDQSTGLANFPLLRDYGISHAVTFENTIWGNMNDAFASERDMARVKDNDMKLLKHIGVSRVLASKTPVDATVTCIDDATADYLLRDELVGDTVLKANLIHANAIVLTATDVAIVFAPRDCAIISVVHPQWHGTLLIHIGAHMVLQNLHVYALKLFQQLLPYSIKECDAFVTPHICKKHYSIDVQAYRRFQTYHKNMDEFLQFDGQDRYYFDFVAYVRNGMENLYGLTKWHESGICTYESAQHNKLFSKRLTDSDPEKYPKGGFNVAFALRS